MNKRIALVSGGIGGLGTEICRYLAQSGKTVIAADLAARQDRLTVFRSEVSGLDIHFEPANVGDFEACQSLIRHIEGHYGPIDILVNAAGITRDATLRKMSKQDWSDVLHINLDGVFNLTRPVIEGMVERGFGRIVNISSVNGQTGQFGQTNYSAAKAGMHGFTMALAREVASKGVTVNSVSPGYCETAMVMAIAEPVRNKIVAAIPVGRLGKPFEIARVVDFLCADDSAYITGTNIPVNGGYFIG